MSLDRHIIADAFEKFNSKLKVFGISPTIFQFILCGRFTDIFLCNQSTLFLHLDNQIQKTSSNLISEWRIDV